MPKCLPKGRKWPGKRCDRCVRFDYPCSESRTKAEETAGVQRVSVPPASVPIPLKSPIQCLQEIGDLRHLVNYFKERLLSGFELKTAKHQSQLESQLDGVLQETRRLADQYQTDGKWKDAEYLYRRIVDRSQSEMTKGDPAAGNDLVISSLASLYEKMGDFPAAEMAQEALVATLSAKDPADHQRLSRAVIDLIRLYSFFQQRIASMETGNRFNPAIFILRRASVLDIGLLNTSLFESIFTIEVLGFFGWNGLQTAAENSACNMSRLLLEKGADIDAKDESGRVALHEAARRGHEAVVQLLLENGANTEAGDRPGRTALHVAASSGHGAVVRLLLENGADAEAKNNLEETALHMAASSGHEAVVRLLLENGADANAEDDFGRIALHEAASSGNEAVVRLLLENGADAEAYDGLGKTALYLAASRGQKAVVRLLLEKGADANAKDAIAKHNSVLLQANPVANDRFRKTALHAAVSYGRESVVQLLLENGADAGAEDELGRTALYLAASSGHEAMVRLLLENGADAEAGDAFEGTVLHIAASSGYEAVVRLILENGADARAKNRLERTALHVAAGHGHKAVVQLLLENGADARARDSVERTALHAAASSGHEAVVRLLLENRVDAKAKDRLGETALHAATSSGHEAVVRLLTPFINHPHPPHPSLQ